MLTIKFKDQGLLDLEYTATLNHKLKFLSTL